MAKPTFPVFVVPVESPAEAEDTLAAALALARVSGAEVHLLEILESSKPSLLDDGGALQRRRMAPSRHDWPRLVRSLQARDREPVPIRTVTYRGAATAVIPAYLQLVNASLLIVGLHYGSRWRRNPGAAATLSRRASVPVLILPAGTAARTRRPFRRIVSAIDFTIASAVALRAVADLTRRTGARVTLVHALTHRAHRPPFSGSEAGRVSSRLRQDAAHAAARVQEQIPGDIRLRVDARVAMGEPHRAILDVASEIDADLVIMGVAPRSRVDEAVFGSTLRQVLREIGIPLLAVPAPAGAASWLEARVPE